MPTWPARELAVVADALAPNGRLYLAFQPFGADQVDPTAQRLAENLSAHGFAVDTSAPATATSA